MTIGVMAAVRRRASSATATARFAFARGQRYRAQRYAIEPDASSAHYFWAAAALTGGRVRVEGLGRDSLQGDVRSPTLLEQMGATVRVDADCDRGARRRRTATASMSI